MTIDDINPLGVGENLLRADYYEAFTKGVSKLSDVNVADLSLQVLAVQTGGLTLGENSDVAASLTRCIKDVQTWYEVTFPSAVPEKPNEYHQIQAKVDKPGLKAHITTGYYAQPTTMPN